MVDKEKVIKGLETCSQKTVLYVCSQCPYNNDDDDTYDCTQALAEDALAMLREREPVEPISRFNKLLNKTFYWCGKCEAHIEKNQSYCGCCGQKVKWNA